MLWKFAGKPNVSIDNLPFTDIGGLSNNIKKAIVWGNKMHIIGGYSDGTFKPNETCLRKQISTFLYKYARSGIQSWTCKGCHVVYYSEGSAENHYNSIDPTTHFSDILDMSYKTTVNYTYPINVSHNINLITFYFGQLPWGVE